MPKLSTYPVNTTPALTDRIAMIDDPAGSPAVQLIAISTLADLINHNRLVYLCNDITTIANDSTEQSLLTTADVGSATLAAAYFTANKTLIAELYGVLSCIGSPGNITVKAKLGSTVIASTGTVALQASQVNQGWGIRLMISCAVPGASGSFNVQGEFVYGAGFRLPMANLNLVTVDTTVSKVFGVTGQFSTADPGNILNTHLRSVEAVY